MGTARRSSGPTCESWSWSRCWLARSSEMEGQKRGGVVMVIRSRRRADRSPPGRVRCHDWPDKLGKGYWAWDTVRWVPPPKLEVLEDKKGL